MITTKYFMTRKMNTMYDDFDDVKINQRYRIMNDTGDGIYLYK